MKDKLEELRDAIDAVDGELLDGLTRRLGLCARIGTSKRERGLALRDEEREREVEARWLREARDRGLPESAARRVLQELLVASRGLQCAAAPDARRIAYRGMPGAWAELALRRHAETLEEPVSAVAFHGLEELFRALREGEVEAVVVPVRNSLVGAVEELRPFLDAGDSEERARIELPIRPVLAAVVGARREDLVRVHSHPLALSQASRRLAGLRPEACRDTASAAAFVALANDPRAAALCSPEAARRYGLVILEEEVADAEDNRTLFSVRALP